ncbi:hypothetical protein CRX72_15615 [Pantoea sp. BRM17]|nr:hypothetical protein CRX72_15615 [Pantoea sp. BRM17]
MMWLLAAVMVVVIAVIAGCWFGLRVVLIRPLHALLGHIRHIASGDDQRYYNLPSTPGLPEALTERLESDYNAFKDGLKAMLDRLKANDLQGMFAQNIEARQVKMKATYEEWTFAVAQTSTNNVAAMSDAWIELNQTRTVLNRAMLRMQGSMAAQTNGGQLNALIAQTEKQLSVAAEHHWRKEA